MVLTASWVERREGCTLTLEQYDGSTLVLRTRPDGTVFAGPCEITGAGFTAALGALMSQAIEGAAERVSRSISLGRVVDLPGLSAALAAAARRSPGWDQSSGRPRVGDLNGFVEALLLESASLRELLPGFLIESVSVEKVLVPTRRAVRERTGSDGIPDGRLPFDAQLWVRVRKR